MPKRKRRPRGSGTIRKVSDGKYECRYDLPRESPGAQRRTRYVTVNGTMADARERLHDLRADATAHADVDDKKLTVNDLCDRYLAAKAISKAPTTTQWYRRNFDQHIRPALGAYRIRDLRTLHVQQMIAELKNTSCTKRRGEPLNATSVINVIVAVRAMLEWAKEQKYVRENVAGRVERPAVAHAERLFITRDDVAAVIAAAERTELAFVVPFLLGTGLRRSEACALVWADIDLETQEIRVERAAVNLDRNPAIIKPGEFKREVVVKATKTRGSQRRDALAPFVVALLRRHRAEQAERHLALGIGNRGPQGVVFDRLDGRSWDPNEMSRQFSRMVRKHKLPAIRLHDLRHAYATLLFESGANLKVVSSSLGHSSVAITSALYVHLSDQSKHDKAARFEAFLGDSVRPLAGGDSRR